MLKELEVEREYQNMINSIFDNMKEFYIEKKLNQKIKEEAQDIKEEKQLTKKEMIKKLMKKRNKKKKKKTVNNPTTYKKKEELSYISLK